jgi:hypothetical protein
LLQRWGLAHHIPSGIKLSFVDWWGLARRRLGKPARKALDSLFVLVSWTIWLESPGFLEIALVCLLRLRRPFCSKSTLGLVLATILCSLFPKPTLVADMI